MAGGIGDLAVALPELSVGPSLSVAGIDGSQGLTAIPPVMPDPVPQAQVSGFSPTVNDAISRAIQNNPGVSPSYMQQMAQIESRGNPDAYNKGSGASGLYQFISSTARQFGLSDPFDPHMNADAAAKLALANKATLQKALGRDPTDGELYLAHQQGAGGAVKLLTNPDAPVTSLVPARNITSNGGNTSMTARDFANLWTGKFPGTSGPAQAPATAGYANAGASMGSTAQMGTFGLNGIQSAGGPVAGESAPAGVSSLASQPMTAMGQTAQTMMPAGAGAGSPQQAAGQSLLQKLLNNNPSALSALGGAAGTVGKIGQQQKQGGGGGGMMHAQPFKPQTMGLQQAKALFDPSRFYQALQAAGVRTGGNQ